MQSFSVYSIAIIILSSYKCHGFCSWREWNEHILPLCLSLSIWNEVTEYNCIIKQTQVSRIAIQCPRMSWVRVRVTVWSKLSSFWTRYIKWLLCSLSDAIDCASTLNNHIVYTRLTLGTHIVVSARYVSWIKHTYQSTWPSVPSPL